ncbi:hypothetical protein SteCoe_13918 [Stentor coeruleus]|uniref:Glycoside hydrolase family 5 domain-containing protein n=1 Tax=Stentor coeruleus TaxID=5963 RepID=A0A1R2C768_9CILI|nr:hypothetical protein SteCoe_13918 [Stentor coeruleus]
MVNFLLISLVSITLAFEPIHLKDSFGRSLIFHGVNVAYKLPPYLPTTSSFDPQLSLSSEDIVLMQSWGFNMVRFGIFWEALETSQGLYNISYLYQVNNTITKLGQAGIYTILDSHQDLLTRRFCGEGMPYFYTPEVNHRCSAYPLGLIFEEEGLCTSMNSYKFDVDSNGDPLIDECLQHSFEMYYMSPEVNSVFYNFYTNQTLLDAYANYWRAVIKVLGNNPYIFGLDLLNEPWPGGFYEYPEYLEPGVTDKKFLQDFYFNLSYVIRNYTQNPYLAIEPTQLPDTFSKEVFPVGFTHLPTKSVLNDHTYCCEIGPNICKDGEPSLQNATTVCRSFHKRKVDMRSFDAERLGVPLFFTEFGACSGSEACVQEILGALDAFDSKAVSWSYWQYKGYNDFTTTGAGTEGLWFSNGTLESAKVQTLTRTYFMATQGRPIEMSFNNGLFIGTYELDTSIKAPTEIYVNNDLWYPNGLQVHVSKDLARITMGNNRVYIQFLIGIGRVNVTITPSS